MAQDWNPWITALYQASYDRLCRVAYRLTGSVETAEDLTQDAFMLALFHRDELSDHPKLEGWLMRTLTNLCRNENRRLSTTEVSLDTIVDLPTPEAAPSISELLPAKLPPEDQMVLLWRFEEGLDYREIANRLGISQVGCRSRVFRALERCRELLDEERS